MSPSTLLRARRLALGLVVLAVPLALSQLPPVQRAALALVAFMRRAGPVGVLAYAAAYVGAALLVAPTALLNGLAGFAYGPVWGIAAASPANALAATCTFLAGRTVVNRWLARKLGDHPQVRAIDAAVATDGFKIAVLLRLTPVVPQNFLSYALALTRLRVRDFAAATFLGLLPITCLHVYVGSLVRDAAALVHGSASPPGPWRYITLGGGLLLSVVTVVVTARVAGRALRKAMPAAEATRARGQTHGPPANAR